MNRWLAGVVVFVLALVPAPGASGAAAPEPPGSRSIAPGPLKEPSRAVTLVTGDRVIVGRSGDRETFTFVPAEGRPPHGYLSSRIGDRLVVIPRDVVTLVPRVLDPALFDIDVLLEEQGDDARADAVRIIWRQGANTGRTRMPEQARNRRALASIRGESARIPKSRADEFGAALVDARDETGALPRKVWLDRRVRATVDPNMTQIGAPTLWSDGGDGAGTKIAVLDSGVDADHPDLQGRVVASRNFSSSPDLRDVYGHGTHVAGIAAGSGAAANGERRGVAFKAQILSAKVLGDDGFGNLSDVIAGVEWAAAEGADVSNLSLGSDSNSNGTDPLSQSIDVTTRDTGTLHVVAAGNRTVARSIGSPAAAEDALTVGAVDETDTLAHFSSKGPRDGGGIKPEITAPGVDISAAYSTAAGGTAEQPYQSMSGTSMATPHVAGAAAVLAQRHPTWTPYQIRAALVSTAQEQPDVTAYAEGGGRMFLPAADAATVLPETHAVDFGHLAYPQDGRAVTREVTWRNAGGTAVTLDLSVNSPLPAGVVTVSPASLALPAGGTGTATATVRAGGKDEAPAGGDHGGEVVATVRGTSVTSGVPFGFAKEPERYDLKVTVLDRNGAPAREAAVSILNVDDLLTFNAIFLQPDETGTVTVRVPPGNYHAEAVIDSRDYDNGVVDSHRAVRPQIEVRGADATATLDARPTQPASLTVAGQTTVRAFLQEQERRTDAQGNSAYLGVGASGPLHSLASTPTQAVTTGSLDTYLTGRVTAPQLRFDGIAGPPPIPIDGPLFLGDKRLAAVDVGAGTAAEFAAARGVRGNIAVVTRRTNAPTAVMATADAAGPALVVLANSTDTQWRAFLEQDARTPGVTVTSSVGAALVRARTVRVRGTAVADPSYDVVYPSPGRFPDSNRHEVSTAEVGRMAKVSTAVAAVPQAGGAFTAYGLGRAPVVEGFDVAPGFLLSQVPGVRRTEYVQPASWLSSAYRTDEGSFVSLEGPIRAEASASARTETWFGAPWRPLSKQVSRFGTGEAAFRDAENLFLGLPPLADSDGHAEAAGSVAASRYTVFRAGKVLGTTDGPFGIVPLSSAVTNFEVQYDVDAGATLSSQGRSRTVWQVRSAPPGSEFRPVHLLEVDLRLPVGLGETLSGTAASVSVTRPFGTAVSLRRVAVSVSTNGGTTWRSATTSITGATTANISLPTFAKGAPVSVRIEATDAGGETVTQTLYAAAIGG